MKELLMEVLISPLLLKVKPYLADASLAVLLVVVHTTNFDKAVTSITLLTVLATALVRFYKEFKKSKTSAPKGEEEKAI